MKINLYKNLSYTAFLLLFLPAFALPYAIGSFCFTWLFVFLIIFFVFLLTCYPEILFKNIKEILRFRASKFLLLYFLFVSCTALFYIVIGKSGFSNFLSIFLRFLILVLPFFLSFIFSKQISYKNSIKLVYSIVFFVILFGIFDFISFYFDIDVLKNIFNFFVNKRLFMQGAEEIKAAAGGIPRVQSVFEEPSYLAAFISAFLPFIYKLSSGKYKIFENKYINKAVKILFPFLGWFCILLAQSPIYFIIALVISLFYFLEQRGIKFRFNAKSLLAGCILALAFILFYKFITESENLSETFLSRIQVFFKTFGDIDLLIYSEQSLGRRIFDIINEFMVFLQNPLFGCGMGNLGSALTAQVKKSPVIYTPEILEVLSAFKYYRITPNIFFSNLAESGIIGISLLYGFLISACETAKRLLPYTNGIMHDFIYGLKSFILIYIILSFYDSQLQFPYGLAVMGFLLGTAHKIKKDQKERIKSENYNC